MNPQDETMECMDVVSDTTPNGFDNCLGSVSVSLTSGTVNADVVGTYTLTYTATDPCGNPFEDDLTVTVKDTTPAVINVPLVSPQTCSITTHPTPTITDTCGSATLKTSTDEIVFTGCNADDFYSITEYTFTAEDSSFNTVTETASVRVVDTDDPQWVDESGDRIAAADLPSSITIECDLPPAPLIFGNDDCQGTLGGGQPVQSPAEFTGPGVYLRTWTIDGRCNDLVHTQTITVEDTTAPTFSSANDWSGECDQDCLANDTCEPSAVADDTCDVAPVVTYSVGEVDEGSCDGAWSKTVTYTATDETGNTSTDQQVWTWTDTTPPQLVGGVVEDRTVDCDMPSDPDVQATDNCDAVDASMTQQETAHQCANDFTMVQTWTTTDNCGNSGVPKTRTVTVQDTEAPTLSFSADLTDHSASCEDVTAAPTVTDSTDNCSADCVGCAVTTDVDVIAHSCDHSFVETRLWTVTDVCAHHRA
jgi:hypothetical protein